MLKQEILKQEILKQVQDDENTVSST